MKDFISSNVTVMISDMDKAVAFYTEILELKLKNRYGTHWAEVEAPGITIGLHPSSKMDRGHNLSIAFAVKDLKATMTALEKKGITFRIHDDQNVKLAFFNDPDGNTLYLAQSAW